MDKRTLMIAVTAALLAFLLGFLPQWSRADRLEAELAEARFELRLVRLQGALGGALAESLRSNYERSRQLMTVFFSELQAALPAVEDPGLRREAEAVLQQRDEIITLLARAAPESTQRLMLLYTRYSTALYPGYLSNPAGVVTPAPEAP